MSPFSHLDKMHAQQAKLAQLGDHIGTTYTCAQLQTPTQGTGSSKAAQICASRSLERAHSALAGSCMQQLPTCRSMFTAEGFLISALYPEPFCGR